MHSIKRMLIFLSTPSSLSSSVAQLSTKLFLITTKRFDISIKDLRPVKLKLNSPLCASPENKKETTLPKLGKYLQKELLKTFPMNFYNRKIVQDFQKFWNFFKFAKEKEKVSAFK